MITEPKVNKEFTLSTNKDEQVVLTVSNYQYTTRKGVTGHWIMITNVQRQFNIGGLLTDTQITELIKHLSHVFTERKEEKHTAG